MSPQAGCRVVMADSRVLIIGLCLSALAGEPYGCCLRKIDPEGASTSGGTQSVTVTDSQSETSETESPRTDGIQTGEQGPGGAGSSSSTETLSTTSATEAENEARVCEPFTEQSCAQTQDGVDIFFPVVPPMGSCRLGIQRCNALGRWEPCKGAVAPLKKDRCDYVDDSNCNGSANDGCSCVESKQRERICGTDVGECKFGLQYCKKGEWSECRNAKMPSRELCDGQGLDEDCDGRADLRDTDCECLIGDSPVLCDVPGKLGDCGLGKRVCENGRWSECKQRFRRAKERCGKQGSDQFGPPTGDEDCDGQIDESGPDHFPEDCRFFIRDEDKDGFGAMGPSNLENPTKPAYGCYCKAPPRALGLDEASGADKVNADCGECDPEVPDIAYPSRKAAGSSCLKRNGWPGGEFDYDCSGKSDLRYTGFSSVTCELHFEHGCQMKRPKEGTPNGFWYIKPGEEKKVPGCGEYGLGGVYCSDGKTETGKNVCELRWWEVQQFCR